MKAKSRARQKPRSKKPKDRPTWHQLTCGRCGCGLGCPYRYDGMGQGHAEFDMKEIGGYRVEKMPPCARHRRSDWPETKVGDGTWWGDEQEKMLHPKKEPYYDW